MNAAEAFWTRFFPISEQIRRLLAQGALGEVQLISATVGHPMENIPRLVQKKLGGGAILDIGCYCVQLASMVFGGQRPESVLASGFLHPSGLKESPIMSLAESELVASIVDEVRRQLGVTYSEDQQG
ncbi:hypothetical protein KIL84_001786 [Mauremys mutica]|uniref:GFO/IDH/MocA-like oxidoreductase domain-containing protein n=1 Tax=Mauremys mutica TaxID=74926 RepID=A0A9D4AY56_9SAUR|nr:hypothetical protein KIL84_001786 [Mauremys mutica]